MFDFFSSDLFTVILEIAFLVFIIYDLRRYILTRKKEYLFNIALAIGFFIYTLLPLYTKYYGWSGEAKQVMQQQCVLENNSSYCECLNDMIFKAYDQPEYELLATQKEADLMTFLDESKRECSEE